MHGRIAFFCVCGSGVGQNPWPAYCRVCAPSFIGLIVYMIVRGILANRRMAKQIAHEFPQIDDPADRTEAIIWGIQKAMK